MFNFNKKFNAKRENAQAEESEKQRDELIKKLDEKVSAVKDKAQALSCIKELYMNFKEKIEKEHNDPKEGGSLFIIQAIKRLMRQFELSELEVNNLVGEQRWLASDRTGLNMGEESKVGTEPYKQSGMEKYLTDTTDNK